MFALGIPAIPASQVERGWERDQHDERDDEQGAHQNLK